MKKINLIMPILATTGVVGMVVPLASCSCNTKSDREISADSEDVNITWKTTSDGNIEITLASKTTTEWVSSIASVKIGDTVLESTQYTFDASTSKITITKAILDDTPGNIIVSPILEAVREITIDSTMSDKVTLTWKITPEANIEITLASKTTTEWVSSIESVKIGDTVLESTEYTFDASTGKITITKAILALKQGNIVVKPILDSVSVAPLQIWSEAGVTMSLVNGKHWTGEDNCKLEYCISDPSVETNWIVWDGSGSINSSQNIYLRGTGITSFATASWPETAQTTFNLVSGDPHSPITFSGGDIRALLNYGDTSKIEIKDYCFCGLFRDCTYLADLPDLSKLPNLSDSCFAEMFQGCTGITSIPEGYLPFGKGGVALKDFCYSGMFENCTSLTTLPDDLLASETLVQGCYQCMFKGCTNLQNAPTLPAETLTSSCYNSMFQNCTILQNAPTLPAETLAQGCYECMFKGCTSLQKAPALPAETLVSYCYDSMFQNCTNLKISDDEPASSQSKGQIFTCPGLGEGVEGALDDMFDGTSGTFASGTPEAGHVYYWYTEEITEMTYNAEQDNPGPYGTCIISESKTFAEGKHKFEYTVGEYINNKNLSIVKNGYERIALDITSIEIVSIIDQNGNVIEPTKDTENKRWSYDLTDVTKVTIEINFLSQMEDIRVVAYAV